MAQFDLYANPDAASKATYPYLLEIQADLLSALPTTVVIPLAAPDVVERRPIVGLNPAVAIGGAELLLMTQELAAMRRNGLGAHVGDLRHLRGQVVAALDLLLTGV